MGIQVTSANTNLIGNHRNIVRRSDGIPYVVLLDSTDGGIEVWKGNQTAATSFTEQDASNNPASAGRYCWPACAIDSSGIIHIIYGDDNGASPLYRYVTFNTSTDTFSGDTAITSDLGADQNGEFYCAIAIDASNIPHVIYTSFTANMGTDYWTIWYNNRIGGAWNASPGLEVRGKTAQDQSLALSLAIDLDNIPVIGANMPGSGSTSTGYRYSFIGNQNDATSFTSYQFDGADSLAHPVNCEITVSYTGYHFLSWHDPNPSNTATVSYHPPWEVWTTWTARATASGYTFYNGYDAFSTANFIYLGTEYTAWFYYTSSDYDVRQANVSTSFGTSTVRDTATATAVNCRWAFWVNYNTCGGTVLSLADSSTGGVGATPLYAGNYCWAGQSFTGNGKYLRSFAFQFRKAGSPTGNIYFYLYSHTGTYGTNGTPNALQVTMIGSFPAASLSTSQTYWITLTDDTNYYLANGTYYFLVCVANFGDASNYVSIYSGGTHGGNSAFKYDGGSWVSNAADLNFKLWTSSIPHYLTELDYVYSEGNNVFYNKVKYRDNFLQGQANITVTNTAAITSPAGPIAGRADVTFTDAAVITGTGSLAARGDITFTDTGAIQAIAYIAGRADATFTTAAILSAELHAQANITVTNTAAITGLASLAGRADITVTNTAAITGTGYLAGRADIAITDAASLGALAYLAGRADIAFTNTAILSAELHGQADINITNTATITGRGNLAGRADAAFTNTASIQGVVQLAARSDITFSDTAAIGALAQAAARTDITFTDQAAITAVGYLAGQASITTTDSAVLAGTGHLAAQGQITFTDTGAITGPGAIAGQASVQTSTQAIIIGLGALQATSNVTISDTAIITGLGNMAARCDITLTNAAVLTGRGDLVAQANILFSNTAAVNDGSGNKIAGQATVQFSDNGVITGTAYLAGQANISLTDSAALGGSGSLAARTDITFSNTASLQAMAEMEASANIAITDQAILTGRGNLVASAAIIFSDSAALAGRGALVGSANITFSDSAAISGGDNLSAAANITFSDSAAIKAVRYITGQAAITFSDTAAMTATGSLMGRVDVLTSTGAIIQGKGYVAAEADIVFDTDARLNIPGWMAAEALVQFYTWARLQNINPAAVHSARSPITRQLTACSEILAQFAEESIITIEIEQCSKIN